MKDKKPIPSPPKPKIARKKGKPSLPKTRPKNISLAAWEIMLKRAGK
jgi:hypothetical protein|tara:strand:- start:1100 stop:1240 length:141 start_codon:yes stop_codon:yes gene_type:complete